MSSYIKVQKANYCVVHYEGIDLIYSYGLLAAKGYNDIVYVIHQPSITTKKHINNYLKSRNMTYTLNDILEDDYVFDKSTSSVIYKGKKHFIPSEYGDMLCNN